MDIAELIARHSAGSGEALAESIERGEVRVQTYPARIVPPPTTKDELVGSLFAGFTRLGKRKK